MPTGTTIVTHSMFKVNISLLVIVAGVLGILLKLF